MTKLEEACWKGNIPNVHPSPLLGVIFHNDSKICLQCFDVSKDMKTI